MKHIDSNIIAKIEPKINQVKKMVSACIQCGTCSATCPNEFAMDKTPRQLWKMVLMTEIAEIFSTQTFTLCSACYHCALRCPRGLELTDAMSLLKQIAAGCGIETDKKSSRFYQRFLDSARHHGRVQEIEFMTFYFLSMKNPILPFQFAPLGIQLMKRGKLKPFANRRKNRNQSLDSIFAKIEELET